MYKNIKLRRILKLYTIWILSCLIKIFLLFFFIFGFLISIWTSWSLRFISIWSHKWLFINWFLRINNQIVNFLFTPRNLYHIYLVFFPSIFNNFLLVLFVFNNFLISFIYDGFLSVNILIFLIKIIFQLYFFLFWLRFFIYFWIIMPKIIISFVKFLKFFLLVNRFLNMILLLHELIIL